MLAEIPRLGGWHRGRVRSGARVRAQVGVSRSEFVDTESDFRFTVTSWHRAIEPGGTRPRSGLIEPVSIAMAAPAGTAQSAR